MFSDYNPYNSFFTKKDPKDLRLGDFSSSYTEDKELENSTVILGYPDDEGIKNSGGRVGAASAPKNIREVLYKMTPHLLKTTNPSILDLGDLKVEGSLEERHNVAQKNLSKLLKKTSVITLGGGHDYGYPDGAAFLEVFKSEKPLVINFDAHLDVRPVNSTITSGTPFYRLLKKYADFDFLEIGIQSQCNSRMHYEWALSHGAKALTYDELMYSGKSQHIKMLEFLEPYLLRKRPVFLSVDIDAFSNNFAPGCSQAFATGLNPDSFFTVLKVLKERLDVRLLGIYEVSPPLDIDNKTSKLAAQIIFESL